MCHDLPAPKKEDIMNIKKMVLSGVLIALGVVTSTFYIPIGVSKIFPMQHFINVLAAVLLGPWYGLAAAFSTSLLRNILGTGSILAFPGSMVGAFLSGMVYRYFSKKIFAVIGEIIGTGIIGALIAWPFAALILGSDVAAFAFVIPFGISSLTGAVLSYIFLIVFEKAGIIEYAKKIVTPE